MEFSSIVILDCNKFEFSCREVLIDCLVTYYRKLQKLIVILTDTSAPIYGHTVQNVWLIRRSPYQPKLNHNRLCDARDFVEKKLEIFYQIFQFPQQEIFFRNSLGGALISRPLSDLPLLHKLW